MQNKQKPNNLIFLIFLIKPDSEIYNILKFLIAEGIYLRKWPEGPLSEINGEQWGVQPKAEPHCEQ